MKPQENKGNRTHQHRNCLGNSVLTQRFSAIVVLVDPQWFLLWFDEKIVAVRGECGQHSRRVYLFPCESTKEVQIPFQGAGEFLEVKRGIIPKITFI